MVVKAFGTITLARVDDGADGKSSYTHIAYADSSDGNTNFSSDTPGSRKYIGSYTDFTQADSNSPSAYHWQLVQGPKGDTGATGPAGKDITSYASGTALPTTVAPKNSQFWLVDLNGFVTAFYKSDGSKWVKQQISASAINAATFNGLTFSGVTFNGSEFISTFKNAPVDESDFADVTDPTGQIMLTKGTGTTKMGDGYLTVDGTIDGSSGDSLQTFHTEVGPAGYLSRLYTGGTAENNISAAAQLYLGQLLLSNLDSSGKKVSGYLNGEILQQLDNSGLMLWSGAMGMTPGQHIRPTIPLSKTMVGWILVWSQYDTGANMAIDRNFLYTLIHKSRGQFDKYGKSIAFPINMPTKGNFAQVVFANDTDIAGDGNNSSSLQHNVVLRYIYAV
uniref:hypothetical protein n=1 Tax=Lacticaseibacillus suibinensis TaxID=2486011 RepID=UPI001944F124|nr:hypothetical protein [Lacticaseibacillus suibinensis]